MKHLFKTILLALTLLSVNAAFGHFYYITLSISGNQLHLGGYIHNGLTEMSVGDTLILLPLNIDSFKVQHKPVPSETYPFDASLPRCLDGRPIFLKATHLTKQWSYTLTAYNNNGTAYPIDPKIAVKSAPKVSLMLLVVSIVAVMTSAMAVFFGVKYVRLKYKYQQAKPKNVTNY